MRLLFTGLLFCWALFGHQQTLCIDDRASLSASSWRAFLAELEAVAPDWDFARKQDSDGCSQNVRLVIAQHAPSRYSSALGLAYREGERIFPRLEVYVTPVLKIIGAEQSASALGRALARVAAHELLHYGRQQVDHEDTGLMRACFRREHMLQARSTSR